MRTGRGDFHGALGHGLAAHFAEIGAVGIFGGVLGDGGRYGRKRGGLVEELHGLAEMLEAEHAHAFGDGRFGGVIKRQEQIANAAAGGANGDRQSAANRP